MSRKENLSLDEFATAPKRQVPGDLEPVVEGRISAENVGLSPYEHPDANARRQEARKALRRVKRERVKGESHFVNVSLDRQTKRRLKLASFNTETSMQALLERAIVKYLDEHGL
jgi:hypothetical protein